MNLPERPCAARGLLVAAVFLGASTGCVKRVAPSAGEDRTVLSGVPQTFGADDQLPEGTEATWDFGDGTPPAKGGRVQHAFPRAGSFTVTERIRDKDGEQRTSTARITVLRRPVPMAVPADVRAVLVLQAPWNKMTVHRQVAERLGLASAFEELSRSLSEGFGFDPFDPGKAAENGFDPEEGIGLYTVPQDPEALVVVIGTLDDAKALAAARRLLSQPRLGRMRAGPFELKDAPLEGAEAAFVGEGPSGRVALMTRFGYLYLRVPGASDPLLALRSAAALPPDKGLALDPRYLGAMRHVGPGDAVFWSRSAASPPGEPRRRISEELGAVAFALSDRIELLQVRLFTELKKLSGEQLQAAFRPSRPPPDLAAQLPTGPAAYVKISASPQALWREITRALGPEATHARERVLEMTGLDLEKDLLPSFTGNVGVAVYLDAAALVDAILGEQVGALDRSTFVAVAELEKAETVQAALDRSMQKRPASDRRTVRGATWWRLGDGAQAAIRSNLLFLNVGGAPPAPPPAPKRRKRARAPAEPTPEELGELGAILLAPQGQPTLSQALRKGGLRGFEVAGMQNVWLDVAGVVRSIERAATEQGGAVGTGARQLARRASAIRDALLEMRASQDGLDTDLFVRFLQQKGAPAGGR